MLFMYVKKYTSVDKNKSNDIIIMRIILIIEKKGKRKSKEDKTMSKHLSPEIRVPIEKDNVSIQRWEEKCIKCTK